MQKSSIYNINNEITDISILLYDKDLEEDGLYYFNARYYDSTTGRFINVDPIQDGTNWYIYCNNNPLNMLDPTGLSGEWSGFQGIGHMVQQFKKPFQIIDNLFSHKAQTENRDEYNFGTRGIGSSAETNADLLNGNLFAKAEVGTADIKGSFQAESPSKKWGIKIEFTEKAFSAQANVGMEDSAVGAGASASMLDLGINITAKIGGEQIHLNGEVHLGSIGAGASFSPTKGSVGVDASLGVGASLEVGYDGEGE